MRTIEVVTAYRTDDGKLFLKLDEAIEHAEGPAAELISKTVMGLGFTANEAFKVTSALLLQKQKLARLLDIQIEGVRNETD